MSHSLFFVNYSCHPFKESNLCTKVQSKSAQQFGEYKQSPRRDGS